MPKPELSFQPSALSLRDRVHLAAHLAACEQGGEPRTWMCRLLGRFGDCEGNAAVLVARLAKKLQPPPRK